MYTDLSVDKILRVQAGQADVNSPLIDILTSLAVNKRFLSATTIAGAVVAAVVAVFIPAQYSATALIMPPSKPQSAAAALMGQLSSVTSSLAPSLGMKDPADLYIGVLKSRTVADDIIRRFDLQRSYSATSTSAARRTLQGRCSFSSSKDSLIKITVEDRDPENAAAIANGFVAELQDQNNRLAVTESAQRRLFFEKQMQTERGELSAAEDYLRSVQEKTGLIQTGAQGEATIRAIAQLRADITLKEVMIARLRVGATPENPELVGLETELISLRGQLASLQLPSNTHSKGDPLLPTGNAPSAGLETLRATRNVKYHETLFEMLARQYEIARIDEAKEAQIIQVVDSAVAPDRKSGPPRVIIALFGAVSCFVVGALWTIVKSSVGTFTACFRARLSSV